jgi:HEAT repeat protein
MPILIEHISAVVIALVLLILLANGVLIALTIVRRQRREKYFQRIDGLRARFGPVIAGVLARKIDYQPGLALLQEISGLDRDYVLEQLSMSRDPTPAEVPILRQLCEDLGLVQVWQRHLAGRFDVASIRDALSRPEGVLQRVGRLSFLLRARSAEYLGTIRHQPSWPLLVQALGDPHPDVQGVAVRALAAIAEPQSFSALVNRLNEAVLNPASRVSLRSVKSALISFPLRQAAGLLPCLKHAQRRIRFLATDIIREMVERTAAAEEDFALPPAVWVPELTETFLTRLCFDENPDVRARAAPVIAYLADTRSTPVLLTLLDDSQWFVRLHTLRALAKRKYLPQAAEICRRLTDPHWMVREAAARALLVFGRVGVDQLSVHFLNTQDRYSREQIADEIQRAGLIPTLLAQYAEGASRETQVVGLLAQMGKTSYLLSQLEASADRSLRKKFLENFGQNADPQIKAWVKQLATQETDPELRALAQNSAGTSGRREGA